MADVLFLAGQVLSVMGLIYGWYLSLTYCMQADDAPAVPRAAALLHHVAMA